MKFYGHYFKKILIMLLSSDSKGYVTYSEANKLLGLPSLFRRSTQIPLYSDIIIGILSKDKKETIYFLRRKNESVKPT